MMDASEAIATRRSTRKFRAEDETICASMILGKPDTADGLPVRAERKVTGNPVNYVD